MERRYFMLSWEHFKTLETSISWLLRDLSLTTLTLSYIVVRSSNQSSKPVKLPVTPSTATLTKSQKNKSKTKKKPVENKTTKQTSPVKTPPTPPTVSSSQVWHHVDLSKTVHSGQPCDGLTSAYLEVLVGGGGWQTCPGLNANEIQIPYDKHDEVSLLVKSRQNTVT